jgi:alkanesulfonate monooxygenase SsuD/methylene tetrahydromethanopterin reductase-like flavin-dependent oxidoreductase (luciferase family)
MPAGMPPDLLQKHVNRARELAAQQGRDFDELEIAPQFIFCVDRTHEAAVQRFRQSQMYNHLVSLKQSTLKDQADVSFVEANLIGTTSEVLEKVQHLQEVGVTHLAGTLFAVNELGEMFEQMHIFSEEIAPHL